MSEQSFLWDRRHDLVIVLHPKDLGDNLARVREWYPDYDLEAVLQAIWTCVDLHLEAFVQDFNWHLGENTRMRQDFEGELHAYQGKIVAEFEAREEARYGEDGPDRIDPRAPEGYPTNDAELGGDR